MSKGRRGSVIVIGAGTTAHLVAQNIAQSFVTLQLVWGNSTGLPLRTRPAGPNGPVLAGPDWTRIKAAAILGWSGQIGNFRLTIREPDGRVRGLDADAVIIALDAPAVRPNVCYTLPGEPLLALAREIGVSLFSPLTRPMRKHTDSTPPDKPGSIALLLGQSSLGALPSAALVLKCALKIRTESDNVVQVLYPGLAVAAGELEKLYQEARDLGVHFYRYQDPPQIQEKAGGKTLVFADPSLPPGFPPLEIAADRLVLAEEYLPAPEIKQLAQLAGLAVSQEGFLEAEELPFWAGRTNRRGIYALGFSRGPFRILDLLEELAAIKVDMDDSFNNRHSGPAAEVDPQRCVFCLTCYRVCPHRAVELIYPAEPVPNPKLNQQVAWIHPQACQACGICIAECPAQAICWTDAPELKPDLPPSMELLLGQTGLYHLSGVDDQAGENEIDEDQGPAATAMRSGKPPAVAANGPAESAVPPPVRLVALACVNSGYAAFQNLVSTFTVFKPPDSIDLHPPDRILARVRVQAVPCAGSLDALTVLNLLAQGIDGVLVCACYTGACLHGNGPDRARRRWPVLLDYLQILGWQDRVGLVSLAGPNPGPLAGCLRRLAINIRD